MAYLQAIDRPECQDCASLASSTLYTTRNEKIGTFCWQHADAALRRQEEYEQKETGGAEEAWSRITRGVGADRKEDLR